MSENTGSTIHKPRHKVHLNIEPEQRRCLLEHDGEKTLTAAVDKMLREFVALEKAKKKRD